MTKIHPGDLAQIGSRLVKVIEPYKVKSYWAVKTLKDTNNPDDVGQIRVETSGTLRIFRVRA